MTRDREQGELDDLMRALGFGVIVQPDTTTRPIQPAWYQGALHGRLTAVTIVNRRILGLNSSVNGGRRNVDVIVVSVIMAAVGVPETPFRIQTKFGVLPEPDPVELTRPGHPAHDMPVAVRAAFHRFARGAAPPTETGRSRHARYLRITNRSRISDYLPALAVPSAQVLVMHEIPMDAKWQVDFVPITNELGWMAHALETAYGRPLDA